MYVYFLLLFCLLTLLSYVGEIKLSVSWLLTNATNKEMLYDAQISQMCQTPCKTRSTRRPQTSAKAADPVKFLYLTLYPAMVKNPLKYPGSGS